MVDSEVLEQEDYEVKIGSFNGPMDLLVYLVQKKEMTLDQIPIAEIADDFLKWVNEYSETDLSKAGDFLFMASRLMALKVQELLPELHFHSSCSRPKNAIRRWKRNTTKTAKSS